MAPRSKPAWTRPRADTLHPPDPIRGELFGPDRLAAHARALARRHEILLPGPRKRRPRRGPLLDHLDGAERQLRESHDALAAAVARGVEPSPAGAWLLDNFFVVLAQTNEIRAALPVGYYDELPKLANGERAGDPRIYEIAVELIAHSDGRLDASVVDLMLREYQSVVPLTMGELWAVPAMLRLGFLENVRRMADRVRRDMAGTDDADRWVERFGDAAARPDDSLANALAEFVYHSPNFTPAFITRFLQQMRSRRADFTPLLWLEQWIAEDVMSVEDAVQWSTQHLALTQLVMANSILSLRAVGDLEWRALFERQSGCEAVLRRDPSGVYERMTFETRDRYRHVVERLARAADRQESDVAAAAIALAGAADAADGADAPEHERRRHVGHYLIGEGYPALVRAIGHTLGWRERVRRALARHPGRLYFAAVAAAAAGTLDLLLAPAGHSSGGDPLVLAVILALALIPATDVALAAVNQLVMLLVPPARLPQLDVREGVPEQCRTIVVVPLLIGSVHAVQEALDQLETQYLANRDPEIRFALLTDFTDADREHRDTDAAILEAAVEGVRALNAAHAIARAADAAPWSPFYLFHRPRRFNAADGIWMGWERKRGKLAEFNDLLRGGAASAFSAVEGDTEWLPRIRYVITLDADTVLPRDAAAALIGTLAHPLNRAGFDDARGVVVRGYGILQPRVSISLQSANASRFAAIFAGHPGVDPYTTAVSDVYQDLFKEGTFTGKGIYDVDVFRRATRGRFPENSVLSHDLIEGAFARAGLVTDVEVFDDYPATYQTAVRRTHRWVRGDWQLLPWLGARVPGAAGRAPNPLSRISRWKIVDNLRRSAAPVATLAWIAAAWTILPASAGAWTLAALAALVAPWVFAPLLAALRGPSGNAWRPYYASVGRDAMSAAAQAALAILLLPYQAAVAADAIGRTLFRLAISHRRLLQWRTAAQVERATFGAHSAFWKLMAPGLIIALAMTGVAAARVAAAPLDAALAAPSALLVLGMLWFAAPSLLLRLSEPAENADLSLAGNERATAEGYARRHWRFFERFVGAGTHWLVPDNFQETPLPVTAPRTSPTNIGLQLLATMSAHDLGYLALPAMLELLEHAFDSLGRMRRLRGHFFNWYDLADLRVLDPPYVSTVDSGNLAGHLIALAQGCDTIAAGEGAAPGEQARLRRLAVRAREFAMAMDFTLLYDGKRKLFAIGYDDRSGRLDNSRYDLLASEARLASFVAVAKGDVPTEHWFRLGRSLSVSEQGTALVSWSGSMFEFLMPLLVMPSRPSSLLDQTYRSAVRRQAAHGRATGTPWGESESAYNVRNRHDTYQYRAFGVPDLALKRGLDRDVVIAPYASMLALAVDPHRALANLAALEREGALTELGFVDALDYTRPDPGAPFALVRTLMAHHIGMSLAALDNALHLERGAGVWQRRFMADPNMRAAALLLDERVPRLFVAQPAVSAPLPQRSSERRARPRVAVRRFDTADTAEPRLGLLGGLAYSALVTNAGGGYSRARGIAVNRWRADATKDDTGTWIYVRDLTARRLWSVAHQPTAVPAERYSVTFAADRVSFSRRDGGIETRTEIVVVPREQTETRRVTLTNRGRAITELELTSCFELVLGDPEADRAHRAFQNLFVETEWIADRAALLASRRPRAATERHPWCAHVVAGGAERVGAVTCESDRARFLGRGRQARSPRALDEGAELSGTVGPVLDPIMALRVRVRLEPGRTATVAFTTVIGDSREDVLRLAERYRDLAGADRAFALAVTETQVELRELAVTPTEAQLYQELAGALIYPDDALHEAPGPRRPHENGQRALWAHGISGDHPIILATIKDPAGLPSVRQLLTAHQYWRLKGVTCDLVILNTNAPSYFQELHEQLESLVLSSSEGGVRDQPGGVMMRRSDAIPEEHAALLRATARIHVVCDGVGLGEIVAAAGLHRAPRSVAAAPAPPSRAATRHAAKHPASARPANGFGALDERGDYEVHVDGARVPPAPWCNVIANPNAGFCVSERGGGFAFAENSYLFRLTPWHNDPVSDPFGEVLYLQDRDSGKSWTPTPGPAPAFDAVAAGAAGAYRVTHAPGASTFRHEREGIATELTMGVPVEDPVKISRLRITNRGDAARTLQLTSYVEWVLGSRREQTQHHVHTERDGDTGALFARNAFTADFADRVAFSFISEPAESFTADREEFIGRNGDLSTPAALALQSLSGRAGSGYDPCAAFRSLITLAPGETREIVVLLGAARSAEEARAIIARNGAPAAAATAIDSALRAWERRLSVVTVRTPEPDFDAMVNRWWLYQTLSCRMWARSALSQSSGAYGFRDQLQDSMALVHAEPAIARAHLLRAAARQFPEGDVQHWWHEPGGRGVRTRISDDLVWLPFVADHYARLTGDGTIWDERVPFLRMRALAEWEHEVYDQPSVSDESATLYAHCVRALDRACTAGAHGLPLIGGGDWNDGMNRVGAAGKGESVWLAWFLVATLRRFATHAAARGDPEAAMRFRARAEGYVQAVERDGWDGAWYRRAYFDDGTVLGSSGNGECRIDSIAQSWAVLSGAGTPARQVEAMQAVSEQLVREDARVITGLTPPFDHSAHDPGYVMGYVPGVRENGAQYTHAAVWVVMAMARLGDGARAFRSLQMLNPLTHARDAEGVARYMVEPYAACADVYTAAGHLGRGGWTWYTGSAGLSYRAAVEELLGFHREGAELLIDPCVPPEWREFSLTYRHGSATYEIQVRNPDSVSRGVLSVRADGALLGEGVIRLVDDGELHRVVVTLGTPTAGFGVRR
jgi:cyclic beta-1,2-glucan synthetase